MVTRYPGIDEEFAASCFKGSGSLIAQKVERIAQRSTPGLVPSWLATGMTAAVTNPAADAMHATPRTAFAEFAIADLNFKLGRMTIQKVGVVGCCKTTRGRVNFERVSQAEFAKLVMMSVGLTIRGNIDQRTDSSRSLDETLDQRCA